MSRRKTELMLDKSNLKKIPFVTLQSKTINEIIISNDTIAKSSYDSKWFKLDGKYHFKETIKKYFDNF